MNVCIPNIGPRQRRMRLVGGVVMRVVTIGVMVALELTSVTRALTTLPAAVLVGFAFGAPGKIPVSVTSPKNAAKR